MQNQKSKEESLQQPWAHLRLPPFPQVAVRVLELANNENVQLHQLSDLISSDPAFASEVLTIANSLLYAPRYPASSILQAISVLGATHLQGVCLTVGVRTYLGRSMNNPAMRALWRHNLATALIGEQLAAGGWMSKDVAFTAGIMHDVGRLALALLRPKEFIQLLETHTGTPASIMDCEKDLFGLDHCQAGRRLIADWKLPVDFDDVVFSHHTPRIKEDIWDMAALINLSCRMADAAGFAAFAGCETTPFEELLEELPARERWLFHNDVENLSFEIGQKINAVDPV